MSVAEMALPKREARLVLAVLCDILFLTFLDTTIMSAAVADVQATLYAGVTDLQWIINAYALTFASLMLAFGSLGDRVGRKRVMLFGVAVFAGGSALGAFAPSTGWLIAARAIMGVGAAACEPATLSILRHVYPDRAARARALGAWAAVAGLALAMGPVLGGVLVGLGGWPAIFWFNLAACVLAFGVAYLYVPESSDPEPGGFDFAGFTLGPTALATIVFAIITGETAGYSAPHVIALFVVGAVAIVLFVLAELRSASPMLDVRYFRKPAFSGSLGVAFATYFGIFSIFFLTALYLQAVVGYSAYRTAALFVPMAVTLIAGSAFAGPWVARAGPRLPVAVGCFFAGGGVLLTELALRGEVRFVPLALALTLSGLGFGIAVVPITSVTLSIVPPEHSGMAASTTTSSREVGTLLGVAMLGSLFNNTIIDSLTERLIQLEVPEQFRNVVITAVMTGQVPKGQQAATAAEQQYGPIVAKVIGAAYDSTRNGVSTSLFVAGSVILVAGVVAWVTFSAERLAAT